MLGVRESNKNSVWTLYTSLNTAASFHSENRCDYSVTLTPVYHPILLSAGLVVGFGKGSEIHILTRAKRVSHIYRRESKSGAAYQLT